MMSLSALTKFGAIRWLACVALVMIAALSASAQDDTAAVNEEFYRSAELAAELYPSAADATTQFHKEMVSFEAYLTRMGSSWIHAPNKPLVFASCVADFLGIKPRGVRHLEPVEQEFVDMQIKRMKMQQVACELVENYFLKRGM